MCGARTIDPEILTTKLQGTKKDQTGFEQEVTEATGTL
jgi:hypothetical protein